MRARSLVWRRVSAVFAASAVAVALAATPTIAVQSDPTSNHASDYYVVAGGQVYAPPVASSPTPPPRRGDVTPLLLDPVDSVQCNLLNNESHMITSYWAVPGGNFQGGTIRLFCGWQSATSTTGAGYKHIRERHQLEWAGRMASWNLQGAWDDFMDFAVLVSLGAPERAVDEGDGKTCYTTPIRFQNAQGVVVDEFYPSVVISRDNTLVITAYPGGGC